MSDDVTPAKGEPDAETDGETEPAADARPAPRRRFQGSAAGVTLAAALTGLADALEGRDRDRPGIVVEHNDSEPEAFTAPLVMRLDPDNPSDSIVLVRPWLRDRRT